MVKYDFKRITKVPNGKEMVDIVLSTTQRKTPTEIHPQVAIVRIREFYIRKVKKTQQTINDRLSLIVKEFPRVEDIHPFFGDLINILYDKDHYKLALGQVNKCRNSVAKIAKDYIQFLKHGDSAYQCKKLKVAALGMMAKFLRKLSGLGYLEKVRQHLSRLPQIDPSGRTILLTGFPNVGKSSFMRKITKAKVDVQDYPFTTQSLFVGHFKYENLQWQVIDSPGILDHPLSERNTIEMQSINALAHLYCTVLFLIDISEKVYSIEEQLKLFKNLQPLFRKKPTIVVATKTDLTKMNELSPEKQKLLQEFQNAQDKSIVKFHAISNISGNGIEELKHMASDMLLKERNDYKLSKKDRDGNSMGNDILRRLYVSYPEKRDNKNRPSNIPQAYLSMTEEQREALKKNKVLEIHKERMKGLGIHQPDQRKQYDLKNDEWKYDDIPEIMDGKNILDFYDKNIEKNMDALVKEHAAMEREFEEIDFTKKEYMVDPEIQELFDEIEDKKNKYKINNIVNKSGHAKLPRKYRKMNVKDLAEGLLDRGVDIGILKKAGKTSEERGRSLSRNRSKSIAHKFGNPKVGGVDGRSVSQMRNIENLRKINERESKSILGKRNRTLGLGIDGGGNRYTSQSLTRGKFAGVSDPRKQIETVQIGFKKRKLMNQRHFGKNFEADHSVYDFKPKHLFTGSVGFSRQRR